jgi:hypothetical protein
MEGKELHLDVSLSWKSHLKVSYLVFGQSWTAVFVHVLFPLLSTTILLLHTRGMGITLLWGIALYKYSTKSNVRTASQ